MPRTNNNNMNAAKQWLLDLAGLVYPSLCMACHQHIPLGKQHICFSCYYRLPRTNYHEINDNPIVERFWGRVPILWGTSYLHFSKQGRVQELVHQLKYERKPEIGIALGEMLAKDLLGTRFERVDAIVPVPLHPSKLWERGYNQAAKFGEGLATVLNKPMWEHGLLKANATKTQTKKSRMERFGNVGETFAIGMPEQLAGKHILLVDDVITTGATIEACALKILGIPDTLVSVASIAVAGD